MTATIVSLAPYPLLERVPSAVPGEYRLDASDCKVPKVLHVESASSALYLVGRTETFPVPVPAEQLADSLVLCHLTSQPI